MNASEVLFRDLMTDGEAAIDRLTGVAAETPLVDFKRKTDSDGSANPSDDDLCNYSKALSGFANSLGGVLIWGVAEQKVSASQKQLVKMPITSPESFRQNLDHNLPTMVSRAVTGVRNEVILSAPGQGYVVTFVPESDEAPHRSEARKADKAYYRRVGSNFVRMEHYEVEDLFGRRQRPHIEVDLKYRKHPTSDGERHTYTLVATIANRGRAMARFFKVTIAFPSETVSPSKRGPMEIVYRSVGQPLFAGEAMQPSELQIEYHMNDQLLDRYESSEYPEVTVEVFCDGSRPQLVRKSFKELQNF